MKDFLTGLKNRNALNSRVEYFCEFGVKGSLGVIYADLNGLKRANDNEGHNAGDRLIKWGASLIRKIFPESESYRAGGDEFVVFCLDIEEQDFHEKVERLKSLSEDPETLSLAIGCCYEKEVSDIRKAMHKADEAMYLHKALFYEAHPEFRR